MHDVFLSHSSLDKPTVEDLGGRLLDPAITPWLDKWNLVPGEPWQPEIEKALMSRDACAVIIGKDPLGPWHHEEKRATIARQVIERQRKLRDIPVLLPGAGKPDIDRMPPFLSRNTWVEFRDSLGDPEAFHRLVCGIKGGAVRPRPSPEAELILGCRR
jgi:TIR domain